MERTQDCLRKLDRMNKTLRHQEPDRIPITDFFWGGFIKRWKEELDLPADADIYDYYDLDYIVTIPNMDPHIKQFEIVKENDEEITVRTGYEAIIRKVYADPMPRFLDFETNTIEKIQQFQFDDPWDERRFFKTGDNQIAGVGDGFVRNIPPWIETVKSLYPTIPVYGSVAEGHEQLWRIIGSENVMLWIGLYPDELGAFIRRVGDFLIELTKAQIKAADGLLDGMYIWGDVAYVNGMLFSPEYWRTYFKPIVRKQTEICHEAGIPVIYHGCGNAQVIFPDYIEIGIDGYNPLEAKSGLDVIDLRKKFGHQLAFAGNMDALAWANDPIEELKKQALTKLNAGKGGGYIFQSDHSIPSNITVERYEFVLDVVRKWGRYPLNLGEYDLPLEFEM